MNRGCIIAGILFGFSGCHSGDDVIKRDVNFYTVNIASDFNTGDTDNWILASDASGEWLDVQPYEAGETIVLHGAPPETNMFNLTFLDVNDRPSGNYYRLYSYSDIQVDGEWNLVKPLITHPSSPIGYATIKLNNFTGLLQDIKASGPGAPGNVAGSGSKIGNEASIQVAMRRDTADLMLSFRLGNEYRTKFLTGVVSNSTVTVDALTAKLPDHNFPVSFPGNTFYYVGFYGYKDNSHLSNVEFIFSEQIDNDGGVPSLLMGYNAGYSEYKTIISFGVGNTYHTYYKFGKPITSFPVFKVPSITVVNNTIKNFSWNTDDIYSQSTARFKDPVAKNIDWVVFFPYKQSTTIAFKQFPARLLDSYASIPDIEGILFSEGSTNLDNVTYNDFINMRSHRGGLIIPEVYSNEYFYYQWGVE